jgi:hypothetical protein
MMPTWLATLTACFWKLSSLPRPVSNIHGNDTVAGLIWCTGTRPIKYASKNNERVSEAAGVTPPFVKTCALRPELPRGIGVISGSTGLTLDKSSIRSRLSRRPRYRRSGAVVTSGSRLNVQFFTNGGVTPRIPARLRQRPERPQGSSLLNRCLVMVCRYGDHDSPDDVRS